MYDIDILLFNGICTNSLNVYLITKLIICMVSCIFSGLIGANILVSCGRNIKIGYEMTKHLSTGTQVAVNLLKIQVE